MIQNNDTRDELIAVYLAGEGSPEQQQEIENWIHSSEENKHYFEQLKTIFTASSQAQIKKNFNIDAAWNRVHKKSTKSNSIFSSYFNPFRESAYLKVAASLLLILSLSFLFYTIYRGSEPAELSFKSNSQVLKKTMADGTVIHLNKKSQLKYEQNYNQTERKLELIGEAFFDVKHDAQKSFTLVVGDLLIKDIGTSFNVKAYPQSDQVEVTVMTGIVELYIKKKLELTLKEGESASFDKHTNKFKILPYLDKNKSAYKDKIFVFENTELHTVVALLNDVYQCNITFSNPRLNSCQLTVTFENEGLDRILEIIAATFNFNITKSGNTILLEGNACEK